MKALSLQDRRGGLRGGRGRQVIVSRVSVRPLIHAGGFVLFWFLVIFAMSPSSEIHSILDIQMEVFFRG